MPLRVKVRVADAAVQAVRRKLDAVDRKAATAAVRAGIEEVTRAVLKDAKALVPERTGQLRKSLGRRVRVYRRSRVVVGIVGPRRGFKVVVGGVPVDPARYAHLVEFGRAAVRAKEGGLLSSEKTAVAPDQPRVFGRSVGPVPPRPFLRPAWDAHKARAKFVLLRHLAAALRDVLKRTTGRAVA